MKKIYGCIAACYKKRRVGKKKYTNEDELKLKTDDKSKAQIKINVEKEIAQKNRT